MGAKVQNSSRCVKQWKRTADSEELKLEIGLYFRNFASVLMKPVQEIYQLIQNPARVVITMHQKPDADAMGSALGLARFLDKLGHQVQVISPTNWARWLNWMPGCPEVLDYEQQRHKGDQFIADAQWLFCLDFNILHRAKHMAGSLAAAKATKVLIDHHQLPDDKAFDYGWSDTSRSSTCEMVFELIREAGYSNFIDIPLAECLYAGLMADTGSFRFPSASARVFRMAADLKDLGLDHTRVHEQIYDNFLENRLRFMGHILLHRMEISYEYNTALIMISRKDLLRFEIKTGDTEGLVNYPLSIQGIRLAALVIDRDEERKWSFRSKGNFDVNRFARDHFEGGGHFNAAGGRSSDSLENTVVEFKRVLKNYELQLQ